MSYFSERSGPKLSFETYQQQERTTSRSDHHDQDVLLDTDRRRNLSANRVFLNFVSMSLLFSANHGCVVSCLGLATARLGSLGASQSSLLYLTYTGSALLGATFIVKRFGARNALVLGMTLYCFYVGAFWWATSFPANAQTAALTGAAIGGVGAGFLWTAQGSFYTLAAEEYAQALNQPTTDSTAKLAGVFAFLYLALELALRSLSSVLLQVSNVDWSTIFKVYALVTVLSTLLMIFVKQPEGRSDSTEDDFVTDSAPENHSSNWYKVTAALQLLKKDPKMKYMIGMNAVFGFSSAFLNSYINGQVVRVVLHDEDSKFVGLLTALVSGVAAVTSLVFGRAGSSRKGSILTLGAVCFLLVALPFVLVPNVERQWNAAMLLAVYIMQGIGRATFEGTLKSVFADFFAYEKEGAFANIILQNGLASAAGFVLSFNLTCRHQSSYCVPYKDGTLHNVLFFECMIVVTAIAAICGYWKADAIHRRGDERDRSVWTLVENPGDSV